MQQLLLVQQALHSHVFSALALGFDHLPDHDDDGGFVHLFVRFGHSKYLERKNKSKKWGLERILIEQLRCDETKIDQR